MIREVCLC